MESGEVHFYLISGGILGTIVVHQLCSHAFLSEVADAARARQAIQGMPLAPVLMLDLVLITLAKFFVPTRSFASSNEPDVDLSQSEVRHAASLSGNQSVDTIL